MKTILNNKNTRTNALTFSVLIIILLVKPAGLMGKQVQEKV